VSTNNAANGASALSPEAEAVIKVAENMIQEAKAGRLIAVGVVTVAAPGNFNLAGTLNQPMEVFIGADLLKDQFKAFMLQAAQKQQAKPGIVRPPPGWTP
jgi:hypothetical protein